MLSEENFPSSVAFLPLISTFTSRFPVIPPVAVNFVSFITLYRAISSKGTLLAFNFKFSLFFSGR